VVLIRKEAGPLPCRLPDGFEELVAHNLVSFKSYQEALDGWALNELVGHYVNYRKQVSPSMQSLLPEADFRLFAVTVRFPQALAREMPLTRVQTGVHEVRHFTGTIRILVVHELPQQEHNALLHLFSAKMDLFRYGALHYRVRSKETTTLLMQLFERYQLEKALMPDELELLAEETLDAIFSKASAEELLKRVSHQTIEELLNKTPAEELRKHLSPEERLKGLSPDDLLEALPPETRAALAQRLKDEGSSPKTGGK
jgi:hypothetical protein